MQASAKHSNLGFGARTIANGWSTRWGFLRDCRLTYEMWPAFADPKLTCSYRGMSRLRVNHLAFKCCRSTTGPSALLSPGVLFRFKLSRLLRLKCLFRLSTRELGLSVSVSQDRGTITTELFVVKLTLTSPDSFERFRGLFIFQAAICEADTSISTESSRPLLISTSI